MSKKRKRGSKKNEEGLREIKDHMKRNNIYTIEIPEEKKKSKG